MTVSSKRDRARILRERAARLPRVLGDELRAQARELDDQADRQERAEAA